MLKLINIQGDHIMAITKYHHLTYEDRCQIYAFKKQGLRPSAIARCLSVHRSTIGNELTRNNGNTGYRYKQAQSLALSRRQKASRMPCKMTPKMISVIQEKLLNYQWSPEQIAGWLAKNMKIRVSHETIYRYIWKNKRENGLLYKHLRHSGKKYNKRKGKSAGRGLIPNRIDIDKRPAIVEKKSRIGDWEIDTIIGKNHFGALVSMVDRASKYTKLVLVKNKKSQVVTNAIQKALMPISDSVHTLTADNGKEFAMHEKIASNLDAKVYFAKPYCSWERGLNEHTNGLVRQYFPKKTRFDTISEEEVQIVEDLLNSRPRKILKFLTPLEAFNRARFNLSFVALQS